MAGIVDKFKRMWDAPDDEYEYDEYGYADEDEEEEYEQAPVYREREREREPERERVRQTTDYSSARNKVHLQARALRRGNTHHRRGSDEDPHGCAQP